VILPTSHPSHATEGAVTMWVKCAQLFRSSGIRTCKTKIFPATRKNTFSSTADHAPFPLRLVYTYRSPDISLWKRRGDSSKEPVWPLTLLFGINSVVYCAWVWTPEGQDDDALRHAETYLGALNWEPEQTALADEHIDFMERHFTVTVENVVEGRLHTLVTAGFSHRDFKHLAGNMFALLLFGYRSCLALGPFSFLGLYVTGSCVCSSAHVINNLYQGRMAPHLAQAELRGAFRSILRSIDKEAHLNEKSRGMFSWLSIGKKNASAPELLKTLPNAVAPTPAVFSQVKMQESNKESGDDDPDVFRRIGCIMIETGILTASAIRGFVDRYGGSNSEQEATMFADKEKEATDEDRRVDKMMKDQLDENKDILKGKSWWKEITERREIRALEMAAAEERRREALMKLAQELVFQCYSAPRDIPSLGASGAIMAITNGSVLLFPRDLVVQGGVNIPIPVAAAMFTVSDILGVVVSEPVDPVDHIGHLAGAGTGLIFVWARWTILRHGAKALPIITQAQKIIEKTFGFPPSKGVLNWLSRALFGLGK